MSINNQSYEIIKDFRNGFNEEAFRNRFSDILS
ncbi:YutD-like domain-containing protein, partial [Heyndrickxia sporothermodurans]